MRTYARILEQIVWKFSAHESNRTSQFHAVAIGLLHLDTRSLPDSISFTGCMGRRKYLPAYRPASSTVRICALEPSCTRATGKKKGPYRALH